ncbi:MAG TPA: GYF domain-containing protein [Verrucomicrobiae bacterium]|nr:GYF domain-containing protein [Verrucomicrobiae bacterium]
MNYKVMGGDRKEYGPASVEELSHWLADGRLNGQSLGRLEHGDEWQPLETFPELAELFAQAAEPPPVPGGGAAPIAPELFTSQVLARPPRLAIGACLSAGWSLWWRNFGVLSGACFIVALLSLAEFVPIATWVYRVLAGPLFGGLYLLFLKRIRGQPGSAFQVLGGFREGMGQLVLAGLISWLLTLLGLFFCVIPGLYLGVAWVFSVALVADRRLEFWSAMELSRKVVSRVWFQVLALLILAFLPVLIVAIFMCVKLGLMFLAAWPTMVHNGQPDAARIVEVRMQIDHAAAPLVLLMKGVWLVNLPFAVGAMMYAYEALFGPRQPQTT